MKAQWPGHVGLLWGSRGQCPRSLWTTPPLEGRVGGKAPPAHQKLAAREPFLPGAESSRAGPQVWHCPPATAQPGPDYTVLLV